MQKYKHIKVNDFRNERYLIKDPLVGNSMCKDMKNGYLRGEMDWRPCWGKFSTLALILAQITEIPRTTRSNTAGGSNVNCYREVDILEGEELFVYFFYFST